MANKIPTVKQLTQIAVELQKIMRIQDFDVVVLIKTKEEISEGEEGEIQGRYFLSLINNTLYISICDEVQDWYLTLVHELKHCQTRNTHELACHFTDLIDANDNTKNGYDLYINYYEQLIDKQAKEFVNIYPRRKFNHILR